MRRRYAAVALLVATLAGCTHQVAGTATWPGARLNKVLLTAGDLPAGVQYERTSEGAGEPEGGLTAPAMVSKPAGCSDGLTRVIADSGERGPAAEYLVGYDGARMVITVLTWHLDLDRLAATADRCAHFETFFDPSSPGIPITTTRLATPREHALVFQQTMRLGDTDNTAYFSFENVGSMAVFGVAFPTPNPTVAVKGSLPQTFLDLTAKQAERIESAS
ncbi:hypothetical protein ABQF17_19660 [Mycolicibacterium elephantis]|uniref:DUF5642 domain-containing protein n=1 Tax=Mycolicibacterium elephantis TaxID=81858 RepID=A0A0M2ZI74_9MYCO|nr:hypothetical protein [Mycolicibacterium elephantis]KKW63573.1 hypothetical protein AAV95_16580 [Mycolicibacterium elephantis]OBA68589.1 hypothetical protein A5633_25450 [Mycolicibacterium elephantis]OBB18099.1 hypothetical protein A5762_21720 [Mycolicibacterium elephantis]OBE99342.1 hypothetical protein A5776_12500 [Mycolicibacterium elephantis]ORA68357.1 hypothetical protein BST23_04560 [Mycolicibacterium elephantis]